MRKILLRRRKAAAAAAAAAAVVALTGAGPAPGDVLSPSVTLGPTTVLNGTATITGTVSGIPNATLSVNGLPLGLNAAGQFAGTVNVDGQSSLALAVRNPLTGDVSTTNIPLTTDIIGPGGLISPDVLSALQRAVVSITRPIDGFTSIGDEPIVISGSVGNRDQLAGLTVNGVDALSAVRPDGTFSIPIPGTSREVSVLMTDRQGVSQTTTAPVSRVTAGVVSSADAVGVRIASVRYYTKRIRTTKRLRMVVTIRDRRGYLVRGATVSVRSARTGRVRGRAQAKRSGRTGQAGFVLRLRPKAFGKRLVLVATAKTPRAKATKRTSVRLPRLPAKQPAARRN